MMQQGSMGLTMRLTLTPQCTGATLGRCRQTMARQGAPPAGRGPTGHPPRSAEEGASPPTCAQCMLQGGGALVSIVWLFTPQEYDMLLACFVFLGCCSIVPFLVVAEGVRPLRCVVTRARCRSSDYEGRHNGDSSAHEVAERELRKANDELKSVQTERDQVQREYKDVKQQLDELTVQANSKLSDQRSKIKVSKRRSMLRYALDICCRLLSF